MHLLLTMLKSFAPIAIWLSILLSTLTVFGQFRCDQLFSENFFPQVLLDHTRLTRGPVERFIDIETVKESDFYRLLGRSIGYHIQDGRDTIEVSGVTLRTVGSFTNTEQLIFHNLLANQRDPELTYYGHQRDFFTNLQRNGLSRFRDTDPADVLSLYLNNRDQGAKEYYKTAILSRMNFREGMEFAYLRVTTHDGRVLQKNALTDYNPFQVYSVKQLLESVIDASIRFEDIARVDFYHNHPGRPAKIAFISPEDVVFTQFALDFLSKNGRGRNRIQFNTYAVWEGLRTEYVSQFSLTYDGSR